MASLPKLLPTRLRDLWQTAAAAGLSQADCASRQQHELELCAATWLEALRLPNEPDLLHSTLAEIGRWRKIDDLAEVRRRCEQALQTLKHDWERTVGRGNAAAVETYYDSADACIEELMWWHTLIDDNSPLAYVVALEFAEAARCRSYLDFGSGVGSGALLFARHGFDTTLADISSVLLGFCRWRFERRALTARFVDLKASTLPPSAFDFITAMDVFEHLVDPVAVVDQLYASLTPGGYIFGRFSGEDDADRPQHIVHDFQPVFDRFAELGCQEVFHDDWLWGHQAFQKPTG